jgi:hypothetical protein
MNIQDKIARMPPMCHAECGKCLAVRLDLALEVLREAAEFWGRVGSVRMLSSTEEQLHDDARAVLVACGGEK